MEHTQDLHRTGSVPWGGTTPRLNSPSLAQGWPAGSTRHILVSAQQDRDPLSPGNHPAVPVQGPPEQGRVKHFWKSTGATRCCCSGLPGMGCSTPLEQLSPRQGIIKLHLCSLCTSFVFSFVGSWVFMLVMFLTHGSFFSEIHLWQGAASNNISHLCNKNFSNLITVFLCSLEISDPS